MTHNSIDRRYDLHTADAPLPVLYREYADAVAREALRGEAACTRCHGTGVEPGPSRVDQLLQLADGFGVGLTADQLEAASLRDDTCRACRGECYAPAPICDRCGQAIYAEAGPCCETCTAAQLQPYYRQITAPDVPSGHQLGGTYVETVYHTSWPEACAALTALLPDADLEVGYWGRVTDPRTGVTCYRDGLCLD